MGLAYFAERALGNFPWLGLLGHNWYSDPRNRDFAHEQLFFEDGKSPANLGFFNDDGGVVKTEDLPHFAQIWGDPGYHRMPGQFNDCVMRLAVGEVWDGEKLYSLLGDRKKGRPQNNCQDWAERVRKVYFRLIADDSVKKRCNL